MNKKFLLWVVRITHILLIAYVLLGWLQPGFIAKVIHLMFVPLVILHWKTNNDQCIMTQWEWKLLGKSGNAEGDFVNSILRALGVSLNTQQLLILIYGSMVASWLGSLIFIRSYF